MPDSKLAGKSVSIPERARRKISALAAHNCIRPGSLPVEVRVTTNKFPGIEMLAEKAFGYYTHYRCPACRGSVMKGVVGMQCGNSLCDARIVAVRYRYEFEDRDGGK